MKSSPALVCALALVASHAFAESAPLVERRALTEALNQYLSRHGNLCLAKYDWPVHVSAIDVANHSRDAIQMPVLEKIGLARSTPGSVTMHKDDGSEEAVPARRYELTEQGRKAYLPRPVDTPSRHGKAAAHAHDLCAGTISLDRIVSWSTDTPEGSQSAGAQVMTVSYDYKFKPMAWAENADAQKVFPMVARIAKGQGRLQLQQQFERSEDGRSWRPIMPR